MFARAVRIDRGDIVSMTKRMLIDGTHPEEVRVVITNGNRLDEYDVETSTKTQLKGNIYLAKVTRVEPSLQAAFVDYGGNRHGFLAFSEIHPDYYQIPVEDREALKRNVAQFEANASAAQAHVDQIDVDVEVIDSIEPRTGLPIQCRKFFHPTQGKYYLTVGLLYGVQVGNQDALIRLTNQ